MKKISAICLYLLFALVIANTSYAVPPIVFEFEIQSNVTDSYDYDYILSYTNYDPGQNSMRGISHWWLEINCAHPSIDEGSIYGYSMLGDVRYDWDMEFAPGLGEVGGYTDWVIKWSAEDEFGNAIEPPKDPGALIGYFGFHSSQPPVIGNFGGKGGIYYDAGQTQIPRSTHDIIPEPATLSLLSLGMLGFGFARRKKRKV